MVYDILTQYWGVAAAFILGVIYVLTHYKAAVSYAKKRAVTLMLAAEKRAEALVLATGSSKFDWVVDKGYDVLPAAVRIFISKPAFKSIVQDIFDTAVQWAEAHAVKPVEVPAVTPPAAVESVPVEAPAAPSVPTQPTAVQ